MGILALPFLFDGSGKAWEYMDGEFEAADNNGGAMLKIRKAVLQDLSRIMEIYGIAREYMIRSGNPTQWGRSKSGKCT